MIIYSEKSMCNTNYNITLFSFIINGSYIIPIQKKLFPHRNKISFSVVKGGLKNFRYRGDLKREYLQMVGEIENTANNSGLIS